MDPFTFTIIKNRIFFSSRKLSYKIRFLGSWPSALLFNLQSCCKFDITRSMYNENTETATGFVSPLLNSIIVFKYWLILLSNAYLRYKCCQVSNLMNREWSIKAWRRKKGSSHVYPRRGTRKLHAWKLSSLNKKQMKKRIKASIVAQIDFRCDSCRQWIYKNHSTKRSYSFKSTMS